MTAVPLADGGWHFDRVLGVGGFGIVQLWVHKQSGKRLAIKKCKWDKTQLKEPQERRWENEVQIMKCLQHPNIVKAIDLPFKICNEEMQLPILCMEYCRNGDLRRVLNQIENCCGISETEAINVMRDVSCAVEYLHSHHITHRDLKPENIVLQEEHGKISYKLIDLGYAKELGEASSSASLVGTLNYVAPELLWRQKYSCSVDYWSLGILFYELITGIRPFLPRMPHTITWMQHVKNKAYEDICAFEQDGKIVFDKDIRDPTQISRCLRSKLVEWFRVVFQWDPKKRGKQYDESGELQLVVFKMLHSILSKKIVYVFSVPPYKIYAHEVIDSTTVMGLQQYIEKDTNIPVSQQVVTDYFGKILAPNHEPLLTQINDTVLFVFQTGCTLVENVPVVNIPMPVQRMMEQAGNLLQSDMLQDYYRATVFFMKQEVNWFQLYIFALTIKVDLVISRLNTFDKNITNAIAETNTLLNDLNATWSRLENTSIDEGRKRIFENIFKKVTKLVDATDQIKMKFVPLINDSQELRNVAGSIDCLKDVMQVYDNATEKYEAFKRENSRKSARPTEMVKLIFDFLKVRETQVYNEKIVHVLKQIFDLESELSVLERIFDSIIAVTVIYREQFQSMMSDRLHVPTNSDALSGSQTESVPKLDTMENSMESRGNRLLSTSSTSHDEAMDTESDVIYNNLVIRYTLDNLISEMQKKYLEMMSLD